MRGKGKFMFTKNDELKAVYSTELDSFLQKIGMDADFKNGTVKCRYCSATVSKDNLYAFIPIDNTIEFCCSQPECILSLAEEAKK